MINVAGRWQFRRVWLNGQELELGPSQRLKFLDIGFDWGYPCAASGQLALAILLELTGDKSFALNNFLDFEVDWVAKLPGKDFLGWSEIDGWITERGGKIKNGYKLQDAA